jgi:magnesium chelatase subunit D
VTPAAALPTLPAGKGTLREPGGAGSDASEDGTRAATRALSRTGEGTRARSSSVAPPLSRPGLTAGPPAPAEGGGGSAGTWPDVLAAARLLAADPHGLGGAVVRAAPGPVRDAWLDALRAALPPGRPWRRMPPGIADDRLLGGLDLAATLAVGRPVAQAGLLAEADGGVIVVPMAERLPPGTAARLAAALDTGRAGPEAAPARFGLVLLDEGDADEAAPDALADRLAFRIDLGGIGVRDIREATAAASDAPGEPAADLCADPLATLCTIADAFGVASLRGPVLAARVARALTAGEAATEAAVVEAVRLVLAPRATRLPAPPDAVPDEAEAPPPEGDARPDEGGTSASEADDVVLDAVRAAIPPNLLAQLIAGGAARSAARAGRAGRPAAARTGRPVGSRRGDQRRGRLDLIATLRAAAPWQALRRASGRGGDGRIAVRPDDLRIRVLRQRAETTTVFCVDASGSAALERLAEAKGAVELLLAESYVRRDRVALVAFRGAGAELVLPPTRSLARAKRQLAGLPGGGGTPLAAGIDAALGVALGVRRGGGRPAVVVLTDGRANVARSGEGGRARAGAEALQAARTLREAGLPALVIDTGARGAGARAVAEAMGARYLPLPRLDAGLLSAAIRATGWDRP